MLLFILLMMAIESAQSSRAEQSWAATAVRMRVAVTAVGRAAKHGTAAFAFMVLLLLFVLFYSIFAKIGSNGSCNHAANSAETSAAVLVAQEPASCGA